MQLQPKSNSSAAVFILSYTHTQPGSLFVAMPVHWYILYWSTRVPGHEKLRYPTVLPANGLPSSPGGVVARLPERREARMDRRAASACAAIDAEPQSELLFNPIAVFPFVAAQTFANALLTGWCRYGLAHH